MVLPRKYQNVDDSTSKRRNAKQLHLPLLTIPGPDANFGRRDKPHTTRVCLPILSVPQKQNALKIKNVPGLPTWEYRRATDTNTYTDEASKPVGTRLPDIRERPGHSCIRVGPVHKHREKSSFLESHELPTVTASRMTISRRYCQKSVKRALPERPSNPTPNAGRKRGTVITPCPEDCKFLPSLF